MRKKLVDFIGNVVDAMRQRTNVISYSQSGAEKVVVEVSDLLDLAEGKVVVIGEKTFSISNVISENKTFEIESETVPSETEIKTAYPFYKHGTVLATDNELKYIYEAEKKYSLIYLVELLTEKENLDQTKIEGRSSEMRVMFCAPSNYSDWTTREFYQNTLTELNELVDRFVGILLKNKYVQFKEFNSIKRINHAKWGIQAIDKGGVKNIFSDQLSAVELRFNLPMTKRFDSCCENKIDFRNCSGVGIYLNGEYITTVPSGGRYNFEEMEKTLLINIGAWNMLNTQEVTIPHGMEAGFATMVTDISIVIYDDSSRTARDLNFSDLGLDEGRYNILDDHVILTRRAGGFFQSTFFQSDQINRGVIRIKYKEK